MLTFLFVFWLFFCETDIDDDENDSGDEHLFDNMEEEFQDLQNDYNNSGGWSTAPIYKSKSGRQIVATQHYNYAHRGKDLQHLNFLEYTSIMDIKYKKYRGTGNNSKRGLNASFLFDSLHKLSDTLDQVIRSKVFVPILAGRSPPTFRCLDGNGSAYYYSNCNHATQQKLDYAAKYYLTLMSPWDLETHIPIDIDTKSNNIFADFCAFMDKLTRLKQPNKSVMPRFPCLVHRCRAAYMHSVSHNLHVDAKMKKTVTKFRFQNVDKWNDNKIGPCNIVKYFNKRHGVIDREGIEQRTDEEAMLHDDAENEAEMLRFISRCETGKKTPTTDPIGKYLEDTEEAFNELFHNASVHSR